MRGLTQKDVARLSGVGEKTISSFETGQRIGSLKLAQLKRMLSVYGLTESDFFSGSVEKEIAPWELDEQQMATVKLMDNLHALPKPAQKSLLAKFQLMVETVADTHGEGPNAGARDRRPSYVRENPDWHMLTSRN